MSIIILIFILLYLNNMAPFLIKIERQFHCKKMSQITTKLSNQLTFYNMELFVFYYYFPFQFYQIQFLLIQFQISI